MPLDKKQKTLPPDIAFRRVAEGLSQKSDDSDNYIRFVFDPGFPSQMSRALHTALYPHCGLPTLADMADIHAWVTGYGEDNDKNPYVEMTLQAKNLESDVLDYLTTPPFLCVWSASGIKYIETSDGRSFDLQNVIFPKIKPTKRKLG